MKKGYIIVKRIIDFLLALIGIIILSPVYLITAIAIKIDSKGPIIFVQARTGKNGKNFNCYKFRSMAANNDVLNFKVENKLTKVGKFIRKTSIDEIPQLFNIIKGDMAFIGPRPWIPEYYELFTEEQKKRCSVLPGLTGLAQSCGRNTISILEKINLDLIYVENVSFIMDIKVIFKTIKAVFTKEGAEMSKSGVKEELDDLENQWEEIKTRRVHSISRENSRDNYVTI